MKPRNEDQNPRNDSPISKLVSMVGHTAAIQVATAFEGALVKRLEVFRAEPLDLQAVRVEVHNLAGISSTLGFDELTAIARKVDDQLRNGAPVADLMPELIARCEAAKAVLGFLHGESAPG